ncbi:hypothetical protein NDU88_001106 [Pleurodeles waltl]|uniref:Uncharacterized protein n=1 Tax=Pleurodeles waltl TaxID=8319 RepID=A0AAV7THQ7_PLEWA|nr:hypothetical protein NDU88_001106 [Pleurodeles waltl]
MQRAPVRRTGSNSTCRARPRPRSPRQSAAGPRGGGRSSRARGGGTQHPWELTGAGAPTPSGGELLISVGSHLSKGRRSTEPGPRPRPAPCSTPGPQQDRRDQLWDMLGFPYSRC